MGLNIYKNLSIVQNTGGGIDLYLDGTQIKGCEEAKLDLCVGSLPRLTVTVIAMNTDVTLDEPIEGSVTYEEECV